VTEAGTAIVFRLRRGFAAAAVIVPRWRAQARVTVMGHVIDDLPAADIDRLEALWRELLEHHLAAAPHLTALGIARDPEDSWRVRRAQYLRWLAVPKAAVLVARDSDRLLGYAMIRSADAAGSWQWGAQVMTISVIAGNEAAVRFYRREGAGDYLHTLIMPVRKPLTP
jgi:hypothetical protein